MPEIAVLGWDPMITEPRELLLRDGLWFEDGPVLPVELSRVAPQRYLTLALCRGSAPVRVYWSLMGTDSVGEAVWSLAQREECKPENIGFLDLSTGEHWCRTVDEYLPEIRRWAEARNREGTEIRVVIWNDLRPDFERRARRELTAENVIAYLKGLRPEAKEKAREYILKIPPGIRTPILDAVRGMLEGLR
ncbi:MAG: hypothetical protein H5T72_02810 [Actinobacteria bacterium]|nr:hypothetical protein [Actinomycetota bacterium]